MMAKRLLTAFLLIFLISCGGSDAARYFKQGTTLQKSYLSTIPFNFDDGLIVIQATIQNQPYNFILDTGAPNSLSRNLANKLGILPMDSQEVSDIHGNSNKLDYVEIKDIKIGNVDFKNTFALISDFNKIFPYSCMDIDGIIGSNLLRKSIWDINFKERTLTFTDSEEKLDFPKQFHKAKLYVGVAGIPSLTLWANGEKVYNNTLDLGYDGGVVLPLHEIEDQISDNEINKYVQGYGSGSVGAFGSGESSKFYHAKINTLKLGDLTINDRIVYSSKDTPNGIGVGFFKNYRMLLNWGSRRVKMVGISQNFDKNYKGFGFDYNYENDVLLVANIVSGSSAEDFLKLEDQILSMNDVDYSRMNNNNYCELLSKKPSRETSNSLKISIKRNGKILRFNLRKESLLN